MIYRGQGCENPNYKLEHLHVAKIYKEKIIKANYTDRVTTTEDELD